MNEISFAATGNLTADPELRFTPSGRAVATIRFAVNTRKRTAGGEWVDQPASYFTGTVWGPMAEHVTESLKKGDRVLVQGGLVTRTYTPSEGPRAGEYVSRLEVEIDEIGPSLRWGTAPLTKPTRRSEQEPSAWRCTRYRAGVTGPVSGWSNPGRTGRWLTGPSRSRVTRVVARNAVQRGA